MADWRQIRARIRRAKASADPAARLQQLFEKTRDAMVAYELGELEEKAGHLAEAASWYRQAAERFRRAEWKKKAAEALQRVQPDAGQLLLVQVEEAAAVEVVAPAQPEPPPAAESAVAPTVADSAPGTAESVSAPAAERQEARRRRPRPTSAPPGPAAQPEIGALPRPSPTVRVYRRLGEPALASEIAALEGRLRQLLAAPPVSLAETEALPASPAAYILSDADLATVYWVGACSNLRSAIEQMMGGRRRGGRGSFRGQLARYLGISDSQATRYLKQHCVVRWLELEETDAQALAHFATAVLRPELSEELL